MSAADIENAIQTIRKATKGLGTDEKALIEALVHLPPHVLPHLDAHYKANYGTPLEEVLKKETSGNFGKLLRAVVLDEPVVAARTIHKACEGIGADTKVVAECLVGRNNAELRAIRAAYKNEYGQDLEKLLFKEFSGDVEKLFIVLLQAARDEANSFNNVDADVETLYKAGEGKWGTDEAEFIRIFCNRGFGHLMNVFNAYAKKYERTVRKVVQKEFSGKMETFLVAMVDFITDYPTYFADLLESAMAGVGTDEAKLNRVVLRCRRMGILGPVKEAYMKKYSKSLEKRIRGETSGDYEKLLLALVNLP